MFRCCVILLSVVTLACLGCRSSSTMIVTDPENATLKVDGVNLGESPAIYLFDFRERNAYRLTASKTGYFDKTMNVTDDTPIRDNQLNVSLAQDKAYTATVPSPVANNWQAIRFVDLPRDEMWQYVVNAVTDRYLNIDQMDDRSGYLRASPDIREFPHPTRAAMIVKTQFFGGIQETSPALVYRVKITSHVAYRDDPNTWMPYDRIFVEDQELFDRLQGGGRAVQAQ